MDEELRQLLEKASAKGYSQEQKKELIGFYLERKKSAQPPVATGAVPVNTPTEQVVEEPVTQPQFATEEPEKDAGFFSSLWKGGVGLVKDILPGAFSTARAAGTRTKPFTEEDMNDEKSLNYASNELFRTKVAEGDYLGALGVGRQEAAQYIKEQMSKPIEFQYQQMGEKMRLLEDARTQQEEFEEYTKDVPKTLSDISSPGDITGYIGYTIGQTLPQAGLALMSGGMSSYVQELGEIYDQQLNKIAEDNGITVEEVVNRGLDDPTAGQGASLIAAALDRVGLELIFKRFGKDALKNMVKSGSKLQAAKTVGINALKSGGTEAIIEPTQYVVEEIGSSLGAGRTIETAIDDLDSKQALESAAAGFTGGFALGGGGTAIQTARILSDANKEIKQTTTGDESRDNTIDNQTDQIIKDVIQAQPTAEEIIAPPVDESLQPDTSVSEPLVQETETTDVSEQGQKVEENAPVEDTRSQDAPVTPQQLVQEFNESGSLVGQADDKKTTKKVAAENVADFLRTKQISKQEDIDSFVDAWNELPIEGKPVLRVADAKRIGELLVNKPTKAPVQTIQLTFQEAVQDLNKALEKGVKRGQKLVNETLIPKVQEALKQAKLTPRQTSAILTKVKGANLFTPGSVSKLGSFIDKVVGDAQYAENLAAGKSLQKRVKKFGRQKSEGIPVNYKILARSFGKINPTEIENLEEYQQKAASLIGAFRPVNSKEYSPVNVTDTEEYIDKVLTVQDELQEKTLDETPNNAEELKILAQGAVDRLNSKDLGSFDAREKQIIETIKKIDVERLKGGEQVTKKEQDQLKRLIKIVDNIVENDDLSGEAFVENTAAVQEFVKEFEGVLKSTKTKTSEIGAWGRTMYNISNMVKRLWQNDSVEAKFRSFVHGPILTAGSQTEKALVDASEGFDKVLKKLNKKYDTDLRNIDQKADMMVFSLFYQMDNESDIAKMHRNIKETIRRNREVGNEAEAKAWEDAYKGFENVISSDQAKAIIEKKNPAVYEMWKYFGSDQEGQGLFTDNLADDQARVSKEVYNREYAPTTRYTPIVQHDVNTLFRISEAIQEGTDRAAKPSMKPSQARTAKKRTLNLAQNKVYTLEPYTDWILRYGETVYDNKASKAEARMAELMLHPKFTEMVGGNDNAMALATAYERMVSIQRGTNRLIADNEAENLFTEIAKSVRSIGTIKALASASQMIKQSTVAVKTMANLLAGGDGDLFLPAYRAAWTAQFNKNSPARKLVDQSTLIARGLRLGGTDRGTSEAYKLQRGATKWFYKLLENSRVKIDKRTRASLSLLVKPDIFNSRAAYLSYYLQSLRQQGVTDIDMNTEYKRAEEPTRQQAVAYAENMVEKSQTASNPAAMSAIQAQTKSKGWEFVKTVFLPFSTFDADFKARMVNEISGVRRSPTTENAVKLAGTISEALAFATINAFLLYWYKEMLRDAVRGITGAEEPEKTEEQIAKAKSQQFYSALTASLNPLAIGTIPQDIQSWTINEVGYQTHNPENLNKKEWLRANAIVYEPRDGSMLENLGAYSTGLSPLVELAVDIPRLGGAFGGPVKITDAYGNEKEITLTEEQINILLLKTMAEGLTLAGMTEADVANAIRTVYREEMKNSGGDRSTSQPAQTKRKKQFE